MRDSGELCFDYITSEEPDPPVLFNRENCLERAACLQMCMVVVVKSQSAALRVTSEAGKHYCGITDTRAARH